MSIYEKNLLYLIMFHFLFFFVLFIKKLNEELRFYVNYKKLNVIINALISNYKRHTRSLKKAIKE